MGTGRLAASWLDIDLSTGSTFGSYTAWSIIVSTSYQPLPLHGACIDL